jgi:hypothetical protein
MHIIKDINKGDKTNQINIRVSYKDKLKIKELAKNNNMSVSRYLIKKGLDM